MTESGNSAREVRLRRVEDGDIDVLFGHQADPVAAEMAVFPSRDKDQFTAHLAKLRADSSVMVRAIVADGVVAGNIGSWHQDTQRLLGYWIGREHWGRGIATRALIRFLTDDEPIRPMFAHVAESNIGSIRVLQKAGFRRDREQEAQASPPDDGVDEFIFVLDA
jgi:RimJ/RimL family protein N-acetyltransferase